jgi:non-homologous end joining protein Ku
MHASSLDRDADRTRDRCLSLVWAVLDLLITHETNGIRFNQLDRQRLKRISYEGADEATSEEVTAA